jgi:hypothetical protein
MQKWEYIVIEVRVGSIPEHQAAGRSMTEIGAEGWELVTATPNENGASVKLFFKRPVEEK